MSGSFQKKTSGVFEWYDKDEIEDLSAKEKRLPEGLLEHELQRKRKLFDEIAEGFAALAEQRQAKRTLRTHRVELKA